MPRELDRHAMARTWELSRRRFLGTVAAWPLFSALSAGTRLVAEEARRHRIVFTSRGKTGIVNADGTGLRYLEFDKPGQATWQMRRLSQMAAV